MATIREVYELWSNLDFKQVLDGSILDNQTTIIDANVLQMREGQNSEGENIGEYANPAYAQAKQALGSIAPFGVVDLRLTGDFQEGINLVVTEDAIKLDSTDDKDVTLINWYGHRIFGLTPDRLSDINQNSILPTLLNRLKDALGIKG